MKAGVKIVIGVLGFLLAYSADGWGQSRQPGQESAVRQYQANLKRIPANLPPGQKDILEQRFKHQMMHELCRQQAAQQQKPSSPGTTKQP